MKLTERQREAIESWQRPTAMIAGAGSGKTEVLTERLLALLLSKKVDLHQILAITFTEKSAQELKNRIAMKLTPEQKEELPWAMIGTFHSFCLELLKEHAPLVGFSDHPLVLDEQTARLAIHRACQTSLLAFLEKRDAETLLAVEELEFRPTLSLLEELLHFRSHANTLWELSLAKTTEKLEREILVGLKSLYLESLHRYQTEMKKRQALDFQDLEIEALKLLKKNGEVRRTLQARYKQILVDEAQDLNDIQREILELLFEPKHNVLCLVGDPKQSIYRFRGANVAGFQKLVALIESHQGSVISLKENFRSRPGILNFINHLFPLESLDATREENGPGIWQMPIENAEGASKEMLRKIEAQKIARMIADEIKMEKKKFGDVALLFQSLKDVRFYMEALRQRGIPFRIHGGHGFLEAQEVLDLLFILRLMDNLNDRMALIGLMRSPIVGFSDTAITELAMNHEKDLGEIFMALPEMRWLQELYQHREEISAAEILDQAVQKKDDVTLLALLDPSGSKMANVEQLIELVRELEETQEASLHEIVNYFEDLKKRQTPMAEAPAADVSHEACQLMTIHAAKGLEFPIVILPDLMRGNPRHNDRTLFSCKEGLAIRLRESLSPLSPYRDTERMAELKKMESEASREEKKRLLYVALTRAEEKLVLPMAQESKNTGYWYGWIREALQTYSNPIATVQPRVLEEKDLEQIQDIPFAVPAFQIPKWDFQKRHFTVTEMKPESKIPPATPRRKKGKTIPASLQGDILHHLLKQITGDEKPDWELFLAKTLFHLEAVLSPEQRKEMVENATDFFKSDMAPPTWSGEHELPFKLKTDSGYMVSGVIDYVYDTPQGLVICDFKTDRRMEPEKYKLQMDIYALALSKALPKPIKETRLLFLKHQKAFIEPVTTERLRKTEERLWTLPQ